MTDEASDEREILAPGATLAFQVRGRGPVLLVIQGGFGNMHASDALAAHLESRFTVVSMDRRGLSRSKLDPGSEPASLGTHAEDAARVLAAVTREPAFVLGISIGAVIGLELSARHPELIRAFVAVEPPLNALLSPAELAPLETAQLELEETAKTAGAQPGLIRFFTALGMRLDEREADAPMGARGPHLAADMKFFVENDAPAVRHHRPDLEAIRASGVRVLPVIGAAPSESPRPAERPVIALAKALGVPLLEFPGGHNGYAASPRGFAAKLEQVLG